MFSATRFVTTLMGGLGRLFEEIRGLWTLAKFIITKGLTSLPIGHFAHCVGRGSGRWAFEMRSTTANRVAGGIAAPGSHTTVHAGPRTAVLGSPDG